jgi:hypothetical protein
METMIIAPRMESGRETNSCPIAKMTSKKNKVVVTALRVVLEPNELRIIVLGGATAAGKQ